MRYKVQVFGYGVVGRVFTNLLSLNKDNEIYVHDIDEEKTFEIFNHKFSNVFAGIMPDCDIYFICTHEDNVMEVISDNKLFERDGLTIIRSTVPPKKTKELSEIFDFHVCHNPEFINGKKALELELNPYRVVIGECCKEHGDLVYDFYKAIIPNTKYYRMNTTESELTKFFANANLSVQLSMWNEFYRLVENINVNGNLLCMDKIAQAVCDDPRMAKHRPYKWGRGWGGHCLPKDLRALINSYWDNCGSSKMLEEIYRANDVLEVFV